MLKKTMRVAVVVFIAAAALASLQAWQSGATAPAPRPVAVNDTESDNPLFDMGGTFHTLEARAVRVRTRFANGTAIAERSPDGDIRARLTDAFGNSTRELVVDLTGGSSSRLHVRDAHGTVVETVATRAEVRPTLDWAALQLHAIDTDAPAPREWRGRFLRAKGARRVNLDERPVEVETEFETGLRSKTTRVTDKTAGAIVKTVVYDGGTEVGWMVWRPQSRTLAFDFKGLTAGVINEKSLERYGGWRFRPTLSWANVQGFAFHDFGVRLRASGRLAAKDPAAPVVRRSAAARSTTTRPLLRQFADLFSTTVQANEAGCDGLHWLDDSVFRYCCDQHDACYEKRGCSASSWRWPFGSWGCTQCNLRAIYCFSVIETQEIDSMVCRYVYWYANYWLPGCN